MSIQFISFLKLYSLILIQINSSYFSKTSVVGFQYVSLGVNEVCFAEIQEILNTREKLRTRQSVTEWCRCGKWGVMHTNVKYLSWGEFEESDVRYGDMNMVIESPETFLNLNTCTNFRIFHVKQLLGLIKNLKIDLFFLMIWTTVQSELLTSLTINNKIPIILIHGLLCITIFFCLGAHTFGYSVFTVRIIFNKVFTTLFLISRILLP